MAPLTRTRRVRRHWFERLLLWRHAYETKIQLSFQEVICRGRTPQASEEAATKKWNREMANQGEGVNPGRGPVHLQMSPVRQSADQRVIE